MEFDYPPGVKGARRRARRPVSGAIPDPILEDWLEPLEDQEPELPLLMYGVLGFIGGAIGCVGLGVLASIVWWRRQFG